MTLANTSKETKVEKRSTSFNNKPSEKKIGICVACNKSNKLFIHQKCGELFKSKMPGLKSEKEHPLSLPRKPGY